MEYAAQHARHRNRPPAPCVESLEDRLLLSAAGLPIYLLGSPSQFTPRLPASSRIEYGGSLVAAHSPDADEFGPGGRLGGSGDADGGYDRRREEARLQALDAILSTYLAPGQSLGGVAPEARQAQSPPPSPAPDRVAPPRAAAPGAAERPTFLALLVREPAPATYDDAESAPTALEPSKESTDVPESQPPAPSPDPITADPDPAVVLPFATPPFDLSAVKRGVDEFFAGLVDLAREGGVGASVPLVPTVIVVAALAYACGRRWDTKRAAPTPPTEDLVADLAEEER
jgi:hypothetical protein